MSPPAACPVCDGEGEVFFVMPRMSVLCNVLLPSVEDARAVPAADIELAWCATCGMIYNRAFDGHRIAYPAEYENALHFSQRFRDYAEETAARLVERHDLRGGEILEIGCGDGYFLDLLCRLGGNRGLGLEPSLGRRTIAPPPGGRVAIVAEELAAGHVRASTQLICCRHVLEHIEQPRRLLGLLRRAIDDSRRAGAAASRPPVLHFEVPNGSWMLQQATPWDVIYEHCSYFTPIALARLFGCCDFAVVDVAETYEGQFLVLEARPAGAEDDRPPAAAGAPLAPLSRQVRAFGAACRDALTGWRTRLATIRSRGERAVVWGAGSKGVTFLNAIDPDGSVIERVVDVNPRKHGRFVPRSAHAVVPPDELRLNPPDVVIIMNAIYMEEIASTLDELHIAPALWDGQCQPG